MQAWIRNHLNNLKPEDFYKEFKYSHISRKQAEERLQQLLINIKEGRDTRDSRKAKRLLNTFESWTKSINCEEYWLSVEGSLAKVRSAVFSLSRDSHRVSRLVMRPSQSAHNILGRNAAYETIKTYTKIINDEDEDKRHAKRIREEKDGNLEDEGDEWEMSNSSSLRSRQRAISKKPQIEEDSDCYEEEAFKEGSAEDEEDDEDDEGKNGRGTGARLTNKSRKQYETMYKSMDDKFKWKLKSGRIVEDIIYQFGNSCQFEHLAHSFTIDLTDQEVSALFTKEEKAELESTNAKGDPELDEDTETCINAFYKTTLGEIRETMNQFTSRRGADYNIQKDFSIDAITYAVHSLVLLYERQPNALDTIHHENWYNVNIWGPIIDKAFGDIKGIDIVRYINIVSLCNDCYQYGESCNVASTERKTMNQKRKREERKPIRRRGDAIIGKCTNDRVMEYGGSEVGRFYEGEKGSKWLLESGLKLPKMLRDMFLGLCAKIKWKPHIVRKLETIGYIHGGLVLMMMALDNPAGYVTRITKSDLYEIPEHVELFASALELIAAIWITKLRVQRSIQLMQNVSLDLKNIGLTKRKVVGCQIPSSFTTPQKKAQPKRS